MTPYFYRVKQVARVVDGDTVDCVIDLGFGVDYNTRVRLLGIDAPESRTRDLEEKHFGKATTKFLTEFLEESTEIYIQTELDSVGKFGRVLGVLYADGTNLNDYMCLEGYAVPYTGLSKDLVEEAHLKNREKLVIEGKVAAYGQ